MEGLERLGLVVRKEKWVVYELGELLAQPRVEQRKSGRILESVGKCLCQCSALMEAADVVFVQRLANAAQVELFVLCVWDVSKGLCAQGADDVLAVPLNLFGMYVEVAL